MITFSTLNNKLSIIGRCIPIQKTGLFEFWQDHVYQAKMEFQIVTGHVTFLESSWWVEFVTLSK